MSDVQTAFEGEEYVGPDTITVASGKGFSNPEVLAKAQATRAANREAKEGVEAPTDGNTGKRRGRKPGSANKRDLSGITSMLVGIHTMLAMATRFEDLAIDESEAETLAKAMADLSEHYKIKIDGKTGAIMGMIYAIAVVYGPRAVIIGKQLRDGRKTENGH